MELLERNTRSLHLQTAGGTNESQDVSTLHEQRHEWLGGGRRMGQELDQDGKRDLERVDLGLGGDLELQGMQDMSQDKSSHQLLQHQYWGGCPPQVQSQFAFEQFESEFDIPSACVQTGDVE